MFAATLRSDHLDEIAGLLPETLQRAKGEAELVFGTRAGLTVLRHLHQRTPCRILFPDTEPDEPKLAVLLTTSGGLTGGDEIRVSVAVEAGAMATVTTQAAEKLYRSLGPDTRIAINLAVAEGAWLEYLPQETILFEKARLDRRTRVDVATGGQFLACEMLVFGRAAHHERLTRGRVFDRWQVWRDGRLLWSDTVLLENDIAAALAAPFGFDGAAAFATALYVGQDAQDFLPLVRELTQRTSRGGASLVGDVLVARFLDASARVVRNDLGHYLAQLRQATGRSAALPRIWHS